MKIAMIGTRGIPAKYGGFESCVEELSTRLVERGHEVVVYGRSDDPRSEHDSHRGVRRLQMPRLRKSFPESPFNSLLATAHSAFSQFDILHFFGCGNVPFTLIARLAGSKVVLTVDGIEWERMSYSRTARLYLRSFAELAMVFPNATVADSLSSQKWYQERTGIIPEYVPYGVTTSAKVNEEVLERYHVERGKYLLFAGRLVHEKGIHTLVEAFNSVPGDFRLVIVGDAPAPSDYVHALKANASKRTVFTGYLYGDDFESLRNGSLVYVHPSLLEGTSISLLGALGAGCCVLASDLKENRDVAGEAAVYFETGNASDLRDKITNLLGNPRAIEKAAKSAQQRARDLQSWDGVVDKYLDVYQRVSRSG